MQFSTASCGLCAKAIGSKIRGLGSFRTRQRQPRIGRNPKTGARVEVPAKRIPYFKPSKELKDLLNADSTPEQSGPQEGPSRG